MHWPPKVSSLCGSFWEVYLSAFNDHSLVISAWRVHQSCRLVSWFPLLTSSLWLLF